MREVKLGKSVKTLGNACFSNLFKLRSIEFPEGLLEIWDYTFSNCDFLQSVKFVDSIEKIGCNSFYSAYLSGVLKLLKGLKRSKEGAFSCTYIEEVDFEGCNVLEEVDVRAFVMCKSLRRFKNVPSYFREELKKCRIKTE